MWLVLALFSVLGLGVILATSYARWQRLIERERFLLGMKQASAPNKMCPSERSRLKGAAFAVVGGLALGAWPLALDPALRGWNDESDS